MEARFINVAVAVKDINDAIKVYNDILGVKLEGKVNVSPLGYKTAILRGSGFEFELTAPTPGERVISRFLGDCALDTEPPIC